MFGLNITIERNGQTRTIESDEDAKWLIGFLKSCLELSPPPLSVPAHETKQVANEQPPIKRNLPPPHPPLGVQGIDFAVKVAKRMSAEPFSTLDMANNMIAVGWQTKAKKDRAKQDYVRYLLGKNPDNFARVGNGLWRYIGPRDAHMSNGRLPFRDAEPEDFALAAGVPRKYEDTHLSE